MRKTGKEDRASREKSNKIINKIKIKIILFDFYTKFCLISRPLGRLNKTCRVLQQPIHHALEA